MGSFLEKSNILNSVLIKQLIHLEKLIPWNVCSLCPPPLTISFCPTKNITFSYKPYNTGVHYSLQIFSSVYDQYLKRGDLFLTTLSLLTFSRNFTLLNGFVFVTSHKEFLDSGVPWNSGNAHI